ARVAPSLTRTLSLHDALPIYRRDLVLHRVEDAGEVDGDDLVPALDAHVGDRVRLAADPGVVAGDVQGAEALDGLAHHALVLLGRSEEHTSELQSRENLVCRLL